MTFYRRAASHGVGGALARHMVSLWIGNMYEYELMDRLCLLCSCVFWCVCVGVLMHASCSTACDARKYCAMLLLCVHLPSCLSLKTTVLTYA
jgi:hypothetical protein